MSPILKNILAVIAGVVIGSLVNGGLIAISSSIIPPPEGVDMTTVEGMKAGLALLQPKHYIMPFLAHALGALTGTFTTVKLAANNHKRFAIGMGLFFLFGGIMAAQMIPAPTWFIALDLIGAYLPMSWLGARLAGKN